MKPLTLGTPLSPSQVVARLDAAGIACTQSQSGRRALFCRDPDQNALEFIEVEA